MGTQHVGEVEVLVPRSPLARLSMRSYEAMGEKFQGDRQGSRPRRTEALHFRYAPADHRLPSLGRAIGIRLFGRRLQMENGSQLVPELAHSRVRHGSHKLPFCRIAQGLDPRVRVGGVPGDEDIEALDQELQLAGEMSVEDVRGDPELLDDRGHTGSLVPHSGEFFGGDAENVTANALGLLLSKVYAFLLGSRNIPLEGGFDLRQRVAKLLQFAYLLERDYVILAIERSTGCSLGGLREQALADIEVDGGPGDPGPLFDGSSG